MADMMHGRILALVNVALISGSTVASEAIMRSPQYPDHSHVLAYRDAEGCEHPVKTAADWARRRQHVLDGMQEAMGDLPDRTNLPPFDVQVLEQMKAESFERRKVSMVVEEGDRLNAYLFIPSGLKEGQKVAAMLALHPTNRLGKMPTAGVSESPMPYGLELAERGYVVLVPDYPSMGEEVDYDFQGDRYVSGTMKGIFNHMRCVDYLCSLKEVDAERIGVIGHSLGGHNAMFVGVFDTRLKVIVSSCGWTPFHDYYGGKIAGWTSDRYMPRLRDVYHLDPDQVPFDFYEVVAALAPRAFFSNSPLRDDNFDVTGVKKAVPVAAQVYGLLGAGDKLQVRYPDAAHDFPEHVREEAYRFIDQALHHTPRQAGWLSEFGSRISGLQQRYPLLRPRLPLSQAEEPRGTRRERYIKHNKPRFSLARKPLAGKDVYDIAFIVARLRLDLSALFAACHLLHDDEHHSLRLEGVTFDRGS
jgi:hypothetical protein